MNCTIWFVLLVMVCTSCGNRAKTENRRSGLQSASKDAEVVEDTPSNSVPEESETVGPAPTAPQAGRPYKISYSLSDAILQPDISVTEIIVEQGEMAGDSISVSFKSGGTVLETRNAFLAGQSYLVQEQIKDSEFVTRLDGQGVIRLSVMRKGVDGREKFPIRCAYDLETQQQIIEQLDVPDRIRALGLDPNKPETVPKTVTNMLRAPSHRGLTVRPELKKRGLQESRPQLHVAIAYCTIEAVAI